MRVKVCRQMNQIGEDVRRVREEQQPCPRQAQETSVSSRRAAVLLTGQQREDHRQPRQEQVPDEERVADVAGPHDACKHQYAAGGGRKSQGEHWHSRFPLKGEFQESHSSLCWTIYSSTPLNVLGKCQPAGGIEDGFIKAAVEAVGANEVHSTARGPKERPQYPADLAAEKQIARQPREQDTPSHRITAGPLLQQRQQTDRKSTRLN